MKRWMFAHINSKLISVLLVLYLPYLVTANLSFQRTRPWFSTAWASLRSCRGIYSTSDQPLLRLRERCHRRLRISVLAFFHHGSDSLSLKQLQPSAGRISIAWYYRCGVIAVFSAVDRGCCSWGYLPWNFFRM